MGVYILIQISIVYKFEHMQIHAEIHIMFENEIHRCMQEIYYFLLIHQVRKDAGHLLYASHCTNISPLPSPGARGRGPRSSRATRKGESKSDEEIDLDEL